MPGVIRRLLGGGIAAALLAVTVAACDSGGDAPAAPAEVVLERAAETTVPFSVDNAGEVVLDVTTSAPGASWGTVGSESAVVSVFVDGTYTTDVVIPASFPTRHGLALGALTPGKHNLRLLFAGDRSPQGSSTAKLSDFAFRTIAAGDPHYAAARNAPVIYGRTTVNPALLPGTPATGPFQNALTDSPLVAFYSEAPTAVSGHRLITYSMVWSNEDGGTSTPALMARWGRTTDIEWTYQVEVDAAGNAVPGSAVIQAPEHVQAPFTGRLEGTHPVLQTCTLNNNMCDRTDGQMRFSLALGEPLDQADEARERAMDRNPWTYWVMAQEVNREGKVTEAPEASSTDLISDPRNYLYLVIRKSTLGQPNTDDAWVGLSVGVRLSGNPNTFRSSGVYPAWSIQRDSPAQTAIALPPGTVAEDIASIQATRLIGEGYDTGARIQVDSIEQAFFLGPDGLPQKSFLFTPAKATLTAAAPTATLFRRPTAGS
ncbi:hypothetical protein [Parafrankia discariae]|uniref:hypothetical protein n=1 Tax=Parafrankia discariae TaxID=365528 RepID=UPI00036B2E17|nr:hypothetical protein [Parafrankia discariae]